MIYNGSFTRKAAMQVNHQADRKKLVINCGYCHMGIRVLIWPVCLLIISRFSKRGRDAVTV